MTVSLLLAVLTVAVAVTVLGVLTGLTSPDQNARARCGLVATLGLAVGIAACALWQDAAVGRVLAAVLVLQGWVIAERIRTPAEAVSESNTDLTTEPRP